MTVLEVQETQIAKNENITQEKTAVANEVKKEEVKNTEEKQESPQEANWRKFRENRDIERKKAEADVIAREKAEKEAQALKAALEVALNKTPQHVQQQQYYQDPIEETEEQRIDRLVLESITKRDAAIDKQRKEYEAKTFGQRLRNDFKDFDQVCSPENLDYLDFHYPEVTAPFSDLQDGYDKWAKAYKAVKRFVPNTDSKKDQNKAENNQKKPQSISSPTTTPQGKVSFTPNEIEQRRADNWARMQKQMKGLSG